MKRWSPGIGGIQASFNVMLLAILSLVGCTKDTLHSQGTDAVSKWNLTSDAHSSEPSPSDEGRKELTNQRENSGSVFRYTRYDLPISMVHVVQIPDSSSVDMTILLADELMTVEQHAQTSGAIAAINAGFFDPNNQRTTSYVTIDGAIVADPRDNSRLVSNPDLISYLDAILNRSEFRHMTCSGQPSFSIAFHRDDLPSPSCILHDAVGGGPRLLPNLQSVEEGFLSYGVDGHVIRDAIGSLSPNARSAVGITETGEIVLAMAAQRPEVGDRTGMSLPELADFLSSLGVRDALNLDGGSSSALYVDGTMHYGRFDEERTPVQRPVKSVLLIRSRSLSD